MVTKHEKIQELSNLDLSIAQQAKMLPHGPLSIGISLKATKFGTFHWLSNWWFLFV
jgi:hypothetical protein